ncbi:oxidoreductase [Planomonospora venezuelensis]|uniref:NAD(P)-dependent dehydrogenase (Short-subunit alcohol dehydrogenase family) n=1 Tax=Planomonospora venezuelensis TaxID=1999 RepID=A0A841D186_PLAVE|nr:oxidoreductase [Planomonospora venezuelensis]MBB5964011.1 NAD(P)-dependent dehydrogenase (short-subunit alcohol dehydrogenase family) [Planomonospora venezuelensis]
MNTTNPAQGAKRWTADLIPDQTGRTFIVTGANSGLGYATTRELARRGAHVVMAVRDEAKGRRALEEIQAGAGRPVSLELRRVDLADLDSVRRFAEGLLADGTDVDVLVNNAGIMMPPRSLSPQGHESQFAANHLGHFALTGLLLDVIAAGRDPRVVTVSSTLHRQGRIRYDDLTGARSYSPISFYAQSKFANVLFGLELDRRLKAAGSPVRSLLAHPGYSDTNLQTTGPTGLMRSIMRIGNRFYAQHADVGALSQLYAATDPGARGGEFIGPDGWAENRGHPTVVRPVRPATDPADARRLWGLSEELTGVRYGLPPAS